MSTNIKNKLLLNKVSLLKAIIIKSKNKVILVIRFDEFNLLSLLKQIFLVISSGKFLFEKYLYLSKINKFFKQGDLRKYRILIIIELGGFLKYSGDQLLPQRYRTPVKLEALIRISFDKHWTQEMCWVDFYNHFKEEFNNKVNHLFNKNNGYFFYNISVKLIFERKS